MIGSPFLFLYCTADLMNSDLDFFRLGLRAFWQTDSQDSFVKFRINRISFNKRRQLDPSFKGSCVPFHKEMRLILFFLLFLFLSLDGELNILKLHL